MEELIKNFLKDSVKVFIGGKNNVLNSIEQKLVYVGDERGKMFKLKEMINVDYILILEWIICASCFDICLIQRKVTRTLRRIQKRYYYHYR